MNEHSALDEKLPQCIRDKMKAANLSTGLLDARAAMTAAYCGFKKKDAPTCLLNIKNTIKVSGSLVALDMVILLTDPKDLGEVSHQATADFLFNLAVLFLLADKSAKYNRLCFYALRTLVTQKLETSHSASSSAPTDLLQLAQQHPEALVACLDDLQQFYANLLDINVDDLEVSPCNKLQIIALKYLTTQLKDELKQRSIEKTNASPKNHEQNSEGKAERSSGIFFTPMITPSGFTI